MLPINDDATNGAISFGSLPFKSGSFL